ncbi:MAG: M4 family metallopeptidase [Gammaproteobacteria bacterium]
MRLRGILAASATVLALGLTTGTPANAAPTAISARDNVDIKRDATSGKARFVRAAKGSDLMPATSAGKTAAFLRANGSLFGVDNAARSLRRIDQRVDALGFTVDTYEQHVNGVPVFGARLKSTLTKAGKLQAVYGAVVENANIDTVPRIDMATAARNATSHIAASGAGQRAGTLRAGDGTLYVFNAAHTRGRRGASELVYEIEITGTDLREFVYVNAHSGKITDQITGIYDALDRRVYDGGFTAGTLVWSEGDATPTGTPAWDNLIDYTEDTYNLFSSITGGTYLGFDGNDSTMHAVNNDPAINCPNAQFTGSYIRFCDGTTTDDIVGHEWAHGYTQETHGLIYRFQSGAMNEAYSDIFGEIVDFLNSDGTDSPNVTRTAGECSIFGGSSAPAFTVATPASVAGDYAVGGATFNPIISAGVSGPAGGTTPANGCSAIAEDLTGQIALIDRGDCAFTVKVLNAQAAGAIGVVVINNDGDGVQSMSGSSAGITVPSVFIGQSNGTALKAATGVTASITLGGATDPSYRWLTGEDSSAFGGAIRDMWSPNCFGHPGKVSDANYACDVNEVDNGGVHSNSGIINHGFALLVDGGDYNGQSIAPIGLTKAAHLYWRTMSVYQTPVSGYSDHASALLASCEDLIGQPLTEISTNQAITGNSRESFSATDCEQVAKTVAALELNQQPDQCGFETLLASDAPTLCPAGEAPVAALAQNFDQGFGDWSTGSRAIVNPATFDVPAWAVTDNLPFGRDGQAAFGADPVIGNCTSDIEAGVQYLQSPVFTMPQDGRLAFDHSMSSEKDYDGGNLKARVNGGAWALVPASAYTFNAYTGALLISDNPMGGEAAFHGTDGGTFLSQWGQSQVDLSSVAAAGDQVELRFELGTDGCNGVTGWFVDNVQAYQCALTAADSDGDGVSDDLDNCTLDTNADQRDTNGDGYGNACDADLNNDGATNVADLGLFRAVFFTSDADADFNGDGTVNVVDLGLLRNRFFTPPGPSGIAP